MRNIQHEIEDALQFVAAIRSVHAPSPVPNPSFENLVAYGVGTLSPQEATALESAAFSDGFLRERLLETVNVVNDLQLNRIAVDQLSPLRSPLQFEIGRAWEKQNRLPTQTRKSELLPVEIVGRDADIRQIEKWLAEPANRLITITGPGGVGKTCLLRKIEEFTSPRVGDVLFIECAGLRDADDFFQCVGDHLKIEGENLKEEVANFFVGRKGLLLLDRLDNLAVLHPELRFLLEMAPDLQIVVTSRTALGIEGERIHEIAPLEIGTRGDGASDAMSLFATMTQRFARDFRLSSQNVKLVRKLCRLAMGVPLSICIAAACAQQQGMPELVQNLSQVSAVQTTQRSPVEAAVANSFLLLSQQDRMILSRLGAFAGPFSFIEAQLVCRVGDVQLSDRLVHLQRCGLVSARVGEEPTRYVLHDSVHDYLPTLGSSPAEMFLARNRHAEVFASTAEEIGDLMKEGRWVEGIGKLMTVNSNLRTAMRFAVERNDSAKVRRFADGLARTHLEAGFLSDFDLISDAAIKIGDPWLTSRMLGLQGALASLRSDEPTCTRLWLSRLELCRELGDHPGSADSLIDLAWQAFDMGDQASAISYIAEAEVLARDAGIWELVASAQIIRARILMASGDPDGARHWVAVTLETLERCSDKSLLPFVYDGLTRTYASLGEHELQMKTLLQLLNLAAEGHRAIHAGRALLRLAPLYEARGEVETATGCYTSAIAVLNEYTTKDRRRAEQELEEFCKRQGLMFEGLLRESRSKPWADFVTTLT